VDDKIKILIASVLKPADDVRSCFKIGQSLAQTNKYEVNIIGFDSKKKAKSQNIFLHPTFKFKRNSIKRLFAPLTILKKQIKLTPQLIIVNTPELLPVMILIKILFGTKIIYDIRENYRFNIKYSQVYSGLTKPIALLYIKFIEGISKHFIDGYVLAEDIYEKQLNFIHKKPYIKLLNKTVLPIRKALKPVNFSKGQSLRLIYSGTIGREYGTIEAIEFCKKLIKINTKITLIIIGYSADNEYLKSIYPAIEKESNITIITDNKPIPQSEIINQIENSDLALLPYQLNPNISSRFPTKIYDHLALGIPMLIPPQQAWKAFLDQYRAGICINYINPDIKNFITELTSYNFYPTSPSEEIQWSSQEPFLLEFIKNILSK
jgi:hypothetical protein